jgi:hypothetical protein
MTDAPTNSIDSPIASGWSHRILIAAIAGICTPFDLASLGTGLAASFLTSSPVGEKMQGFSMPSSMSCSSFLSGSVLRKVFVTEASHG